MKIVLATRNPHKVREITTILEDAGVEWVPYSSLSDAPPLREEGVSLQENAAAKAETGAAFTELNTLLQLDAMLAVAAQGIQQLVHLQQRLVLERLQTVKLPLDKS